jgi:hypothetical protein
MVILFTTTWPPWAVTFFRYSSRFFTSIIYLPAKNFFIKFNDPFRVIGANFKMNHARHTAPPFLGLKIRFIIAGNKIYNIGAPRGRFTLGFPEFKKL